MRERRLEKEGTAQRVRLKRDSRGGWRTEREGQWTERVRKAETDARWWKRDDEKGRESGRDGGESDERGKAKKCVLRRDEDKVTGGRR